MFKTRFNYKFKKIIVLSTLAAIGCSSNLIQSMEEQNVDDLILSLTQKDREKLLELMCEKDNVDAKTELENFQANGRFKRREKVVDGADEDRYEENIDIDNWVVAQISFESNLQTELRFALVKNKAKKCIYLLPDGEKVEEIVADFLENYKKLKGTKFDPDTNEKEIWKKSRTFSEFCKQLDENKSEDKEKDINKSGDEDRQKEINKSKDKETDIVSTTGFDRFARKFGMSPKVGLGVVVALGTIGLGGGIISISR